MKDARARRGKRRGVLLSPSRVFLARSIKTDQKNYPAPATQAIERATKIYILNTHMVITLSISAPIDVVDHNVKIGV